ncbi:hypothetical protein SmJEL517_g02220 [Synchytrium microbalum]|uniref:LIM zinc-binding domain-containing protein n=1 Tax=Synchytrium microbalum TaxID=1806994 RepID=A0A507CBI5_9FUNG|nr:uncharacterized protein SmJEL517_g02220 [Synchytrium microbalum]TPX35366.1 hypothetical protein SmJEL517_g02220 [Synchytrium microbalum]
MASQNCNSCSKTVYPTERIDAAGSQYHKAGQTFLCSLNEPLGCFKCHEETCKIQLSLKTFKAAEGQVWCEKHLPKPKATAIADSVSVMHAMHAPKKVTEGLHTIKVGTGEVPSYGLDTVSNQHALNAPKKPIENLGNVQKGDYSKEQSGVASQ